MVALSAIGAAKLTVASPMINESYELRTRKITRLITSKLFLLPLFTPFYVSVPQISTHILLLSMFVYTYIYVYIRLCKNPSGTLWKVLGYYSSLTL